MNTRRSGFTLVELSVVLVIISLLVGAIVAGTSLVRAARVKSVTSDKEAYQNAMLAFRDKYSALPGDMINATDFWGYAPGVPAGTRTAMDTACAKLTTRSTTKATCNGNGNDSIYERDGTGWLIHEQFRVWQHLANAGMIEGSYSGVADCNAPSPCATPGVNTPVSSLPDATWYIADPNGLTGGGLAWLNALWGERDGKHILYFGGTITADLGTLSSNPFQPILTPAEAWAIDDKYDDSSPGRGKVRVIAPIPPNSYLSDELHCANDDDASVAKYNLTKTTLECSLYFMLPF